VISSAEISEAFRSLGVGPADVLFVHSGLQSALRVQGDTRQAKTETVLDALDAVVSDGVLILPTFTYSFCRGEDFDVERSPSTVGMLTEHFRRLPGVRRTAEPIFSCAIRGRLPDEWEDRLYAPRDGDCFGSDSVFAFLHEANAKILFFGVGFQFCTFVYRVEQQLGVPYRYMKDFRGEVISHGRRTSVTARYFVRDLGGGVENAFLPLGAELSARGLMHEHRIARAPRLLCCAVRDVHGVAVEKVHERPDYLLTRGQPEAVVT